MSLRSTFLAALFAWAGSFVFISRFGTWAPLALVGPLLAAIALVREPAERELTRPSASLLLIGLIASAAMIFATYLLFDLFKGTVVHTLTLSLYAALRAPGFTPLERAPLITLVSLSEELLFRGTVLPDRRKGAWRAVLLNSLIVGAAHLTSENWLLVVVAIITGAVWGGLRVWTRSCVPSAIMHVGWDLAILVVRPLT